MEMVFKQVGKRKDVTEIALVAENDAESLMLEMLFMCGVELKECVVNEEDDIAWLFKLKKSPREFFKDSELKTLEGLWGKG